jgi:hypothetical protein
MLIAYTQVGSARDNMEVYVIEVYVEREVGRDCEKVAFLP